MARHPRTKTQLIREIRRYRPDWPDGPPVWPAWFYANMYEWNDLVMVLDDLGHDCTDLWRRH